MTLQRARVIPRAVDAAPPAPSAARNAGARPTRGARATRLAREVQEARDEAARILDQARRDAERLVADTAERAGAEAREREVARLAAGFLALREAEERRLDREKDRVVELAALLAERLVGEALRLDPARVAELAAAAMKEVRGARRVRIDACPDDVGPLKDALGAAGHVADVQPDATLPRGSLVVHTELGRVDARLHPQLERLAQALREALG